MTEVIGGAREATTGLVGRRVELGWLRTRFEQAMRGIPQLVVVEGEMGIGKTRLAAEVLDGARRAGAVILRGRSYEHLRYAYLPLRESLLPRLERWASDREDLALERDHLRRLLDGSFEPTGPTPSGTGDAGERAQQLLVLTRSTIALARTEPCVLFLDDLQWADDATVEFLRHLLFRFEDESVPVLVLATRRTEAAASGSEGLARLGAETRAATLTLHPLPPLEAAELARELSGSDRVEQARRVADASGGNPLLIDVLTRGGPVPRSPSGTPTVTGTPAHPTTDAVRARLERLREPTQRVIELAAFLVPAGRVTTIATVTGLDDDAVDEAVQEAVDAGILTDHGDAVTFRHPLDAHLAYERVSVRRRRTLHARIADALLTDDPDDVRTVTHHLVEAGNRADSALVHQYARRAGDLAFAATAWDDAARYYEAALATMPDAADPIDAATQAALLRLAGLSRRGNLELDRAVEHFDAALAVLDDDAALETRVDLHTWRIRCGIGSVRVLDAVRDAEPLARLAGEIEDTHPALAAEAFVELAQSAWIAGDMGHSERNARHAIELAARAGNWEAYSRAAMALTVPQWMRYDLDGSLAALRDGVAHEADAGAEAELAGGPRFRIPLVLAWSGQLDAAVEAAEECAARAERVNYPLELGLPLAALALVGVVRGRFDDTDHAAHRALVVQRLSGYHWAAGLYLPARFAACLARGAYDDARAALADWQETANDQEQWTIALLRRYADAVERDLPVRGGDVVVPHAPAVGADTWAAVAVELARREGITIDARRAHDLLAECERRGGRVVSGLGFLLARVRGVAADLMGDEDTAIAAFRNAITVADALDAAPERARALTDLAVVHLRRGDHDRAAELLDDATQQFARLGMPVDADRAAALDGGERRAVRVEATRMVGSTRTADAVETDVVLLFTDVVDSTRLTEELGNAVYRERARRMESLVTSAITAHRGTVATGISLGDGFIGLFPTVRHALDAAQTCARDAYASTELRLHVGLHAGPVLVDGTRIYGRPVNFAARVCALAGADEILVSELVRDRASALADVAFVDRGAHELKGIAGAHRLYAVVDARALAALDDAATEASEL